MITKRSRSLIMVVLACIGASLFINVTPAAAAALTNVSFAVSKPHPGDTSARYSWSFTTATTGTVASVTFTVPSGTAGASLTPIDYYGVGVGTAALSGTTVTYTVTTPGSIVSGTPILITIDGFTNTATPGTYSTDVTTLTAGSAAIDGNTTSGNTVTFNNNTTAVTVVIARTMSFTNSATAITMLLDPSLAANSDKSNVATSLGLATNANFGYTLSAKATALTGSGATIAPITVGTGTGVASGSFITDTWGFTIPSSTNGGAGTLTLSGQLATSKYVGHTTSNQSIAVNNGPTNGDTIPVTTRVKIDYLQPAVTYSSTITYTAVPSY